MGGRLREHLGSASRCDEVGGGASGANSDTGRGGTGWRCRHSEGRLAGRRHSGGQSVCACLWRSEGWWAWGEGK
jgi:hypothetical protein